MVEEQFVLYQKTAAAMMVVVLVRCRKAEEAAQPEGAEEVVAAVPAPVDFVLGGLHRYWSGQMPSACKR